MPTPLITHSGPFHADDVLAYAVLSKIHPDNRLIRTRDQRLIDAAGENAVVFDVGGVYDPEARRYDHHQPGRPERAPGQPYSAFGLVWKHHGHEYLSKLGIPLEQIEDVWTSIDEDFVTLIDGVDNGTLEAGHPALHETAFAAQVAGYVPPFDNDDPYAELEGFTRAALMAGDTLKNTVGKRAELLRARGMVLDALEARERPEVLELLRWTPYLETLLEADPEGEVLFVVFPKGGDQWGINTVQISPQSYESRKSLPKDWAGLRGAKLAEASGVESADFCHLARFTAGAGSRDDILKMADLACSQNDHEKTTKLAV